MNINNNAFRINSAEPSIVPPAQIEDKVVAKPIVAAILMIAPSTKIIIPKLAIKILPNCMNLFLFVESFVESPS